MTEAKSVNEVKIAHIFSHAKSIAMFASVLIKETLHNSLNRVVG